jgi:hypothetical protein
MLRTKRTQKTVDKGQRSHTWTAVGQDAGWKSGVETIAGIDRQVQTLSLEVQFLPLHHAVVY